MSWYYDEKNKMFTTDMGDYTAIVGTFGALKEFTYLKTGVEVMMRNESHYKYTIEYCETGRKEPDLYDDKFNGDYNNRVIAASAAKPESNRTGQLDY